MIQTTSLELSKKLYEMFGWKSAELHCYVKWHDIDEPNVCDPTCLSDRVGTKDEFIVWAYDLAYLLEKLPDWTNIWRDGVTKKYFARVHKFMPSDFIEQADNPTEAAGLLCLELGTRKLLK